MYGTETDNIQATVISTKYHQNNTHFFDHCAAVAKDICRAILCQANVLYDSNA